MTFSNPDIEFDPSKWHVTRHVEPIDSTEKLLIVEFGRMSMSLGPMCTDMEMTTLMDLNTYAKILSGEYEVSPLSVQRKDLVVIDRQGNEIKDLTANYGKVLSKD